MDGRLVASAVLPVPSIEVRAGGPACRRRPVLPAGERLLTVRIVRRHAAAQAPAGFPGSGRLPVPAGVRTRAVRVGRRRTRLAAELGDGRLAVSTGDGVVAFDHACGRLAGWVHAGRELVTEPLRVHLTRGRSSTTTGGWTTNCGVPTGWLVRERCHRFSWHEEGGTVVAEEAVGSWRRDSCGCSNSITATRVDRTACCAWTAGEPEGYDDLVQVIGAELKVARRFSHASYYGRGPGRTTPTPARPPCSDATTRTSPT